MGQQGPQGPAGTSAAVAIGSAYGLEQNDLDIPLSPLFPTPSLQLAPLKYGTPQSPGNPFFTFTPYVDATTGSCYTINQAGTYLLQYGLVGATPGGDQPAQYWICIQIQGPSAPSGPKEIGAIPLSLSTYVGNNTSGPFVDVCGFGQISTHLLPGDVASLQVMVIGSTLTLSASNITNTDLSTTPVARGPTLTITKIAD